MSLCRKKGTERASGGDKKREMKHNLRQYVTALTLSVLFGLGWGIGFAGTSNITMQETAWALQALFIILTTFQGLVIFIMQCVCHNDARKEWKRWAQVITCNKDSKKPKDVTHSTTSVELTYHSKVSDNNTAESLGTLKKAIKKDIENSARGTLTSKFDSATETIDEDLSLKEEEKIKYELLSHTQSDDTPTPEEEKVTVVDASPLDNGALISEVPVSSNTKALGEIIEQESSDPDMPVEMPDTLNPVTNPRVTADPTVSSTVTPTPDEGGAVI